MNKFIDLVKKYLDGKPVSLQELKENALLAEHVADTAKLVQYAAKSAYYSKLNMSDSINHSDYDGVDAQIHLKSYSKMSKELGGNL